MSAGLVITADDSVLVLDVFVDEIEGELLPVESRFAISLDEVVVSFDRVVDIGWC